jgi:hypothetical protein
MKSLGITIDRILKVDPTLDTQLLPIKSKWERYPSRTLKYWKELGDVLNSIRGHPKLSEIRNIVLSKKRPARKLCSFEPPARNERVIGIIPEHMADRVRRHDRQTIEVAKKRMEASMTKNVELMAYVSRQENRMDIQMKRIWFELKDYFKLWDKPVSYGIRKQEPFLVVVSIPEPPFHIMPGSTPQSGVMRIDSDMMRKFFGMMGMEPPPGMFPPEDDDK